MKRYLSLVLILSISLSFSAFAACPISEDNQSQAMVEYSENGEPYLTDCILIQNGVAKRITASELEEILGDDISDPLYEDANLSSTPEPRRWEDIYQYENVQKVETKVYKTLSQPVSSWSEIGPESGTSTVAQAKTFGRTYSLSLTPPAVNSVTASIGAAYTITNSTTVSSGLNINPNTTARLRFAPECEKYVGTLIHRKWNYDMVSSSTLTVYQPTNALNGLFYIEYQ